MINRIILVGYELKPIPKHDGYFINTKAEVYSQWVNKGIHGVCKQVKKKKLKGSKTKHGYTMFKFGRKEKFKYLHRLMIEVFVGEIPKSMVVCHKNDNPKDNLLSNLYVGTQKQNIGDSMRLNNFQSGVTNGCSKLKKEDVIFIRKLKKADKHLPNREIAKKFNVDRKTIDNVINCFTYKNIT